MRAVTHGASELNAQEQAKRRDRVGYMALGAPDFPEAGNLRERQTPDIGHSFFTSAPLLRSIIRRCAIKKL